MSAARTICIIAALLTTACVETLDNRYASYAEAVADEAVPHGWVPAWLPLSSRNIRETHNIDTNHFMVKFEFPEAESGFIPAGCVEARPASLPRAPFSRSWWPADIPGPATAPHKYFRCPERQYVALGRGEAFVWSVG